MYSTMTSIEVVILCEETLGVSHETFVHTLFYLYGIRLSEQVCV